MTALLKLNAPAVVLLHTVLLAGTVTAGVGDTLMVNVRTAPPQPAEEEVTVTTADTVAVPVLMVVNAGIVPVPVVPRPIDGVVLVQLKIVPGTELVNMNAPAVPPLHTVVLAGAEATGVGNTLTVNDCSAPGQPANIGVTAITAVAVTEPVLMAVNAAMLPEPDAARPMVELELVQEKVVPGAVLPNVKPPAVVLLQTVTLEGNTFMVGVGDTLTVNNFTAPRQVAAVGVTVNTPVAVTVPVLVPVKDVTEDVVPDAPTPIDVLLLAHVYVVPVTVLLKLTVVVGLRLQTVCVAGNTFIVGVGDTLTVKDCAAPRHVLA